ncbi:MAG: phosphatase PAP2 family protein [Armatimonadetes bacterium]|nr:phosphatase PAP2 family protein [Armatimonadota bacterium]
MLGAWDDAVFKWINGGWSSPFLDEIFRFFTLATKIPWVVALLAVILLTYILAGPKTRAAAIQAMIAWPLANEFTDIIKNSIQTLRPCVVHPDYARVFDYAGKAILLDSSGTLSAHAANMAAVATVVALRLKWWGVPWILFALLSGLSRIYVGVHYPSQVILGWFAGTIIGVAIVKAWDWYSRRRIISSPEPPTTP